MNIYEFLMVNFKNNEFALKLLSETCNALLIFHLFLLFITFVLGLSLILYKIFCSKNMNLTDDESFERALILILLIVFFWIIPFMLLKDAITKLWNKYKKRGETTNANHNSSN